MTQPSEWENKTVKKYKNFGSHTEYLRDWRKKNPSKASEYSRRFRENHHDLSVEQGRRYRKEHRDERNEADRKHNELLRQTVDFKFDEYKRSAKKRGAKFDLTIEQFKNFWQKPCHYCGEPIKNIGLDKVDRFKGYVIENVVPCCTACNFMKGRLPLEVFIDRCHKVSGFNALRQRKEILEEVRKEVRKSFVDDHPGEDTDEQFKNVVWNACLVKVSNYLEELLDKLSH